MTLLQVFFIVSAFLLLILGIDVARKQRFNFLHIFIFLGIAIGLVIFTLFPSVLQKFGQIFGVQRGADVLVYLSIIFLIYFVLFLFNKIEENNTNLTSVIRNLALQSAKKDIKIHSDIIFIIPVYNEKDVIEKTIETILKKGYKDIIIVNDGSTDGTDKILDKYKDKIIVINHIKNRGQGAALETGFEYVRRYLMDNEKLKYVVTFDADGQHDINDLTNFLKEFRKDKKLEVVLGSRFLNKNTKIPLGRKIILLGGKLFTFLISGKYFSDVHNGYRVLKKEALNKIKITNDGMAHASEIQDIIARKKIKFTEVPVNIKYTEYSLSKGQKSSNAIFIALKMIWEKFFK